MNPTLETLPPELDPEFVIPPEAIPDLSKLVTQDDIPLDSYLAEKQQRLLTEPLYSSWPGPGEGRPFLVQANVGYFYGDKVPPLVPDVLLSLDVQLSEDLRTKDGHSYFQWRMTKEPDVIIEMVSDRRGGEASLKMRRYARLHVAYYVIFDPEEHLGDQVLRTFVNVNRTYEPIAPGWFPEVGLGLTLWEGTFEGQHLPWLRWCDRDGKVIPTGAERAEQERQRAEQESQRAEQESRRAELAQQSAERLRAQLRALGVDPDA